LTILKSNSGSLSLYSLRTTFGVSRVVSDAHLHLIALLWTMRLLSQWMLHWWRVNSSTARETLPYTHP